MHESTVKSDNLPVEGLFQCCVLKWNVNVSDLSKSLREWMKIATKLSSF